MKSLISFIDEGAKEKKLDNLRILVVSSGALKSEKDKAPIFHTASRFKDEAKKLGHDVYILQVENAYISYENNIHKIFNHDDKEGFELNSTTLLLLLEELYD